MVEMNHMKYIKKKKSLDWGLAQGAPSFSSLLNPKS